MAFNVNLSQKDIDELYALKSSPARPSNLQGHCGGCGRGIPVGYLPIVTKWGIKQFGGQKVMTPAEMYCRTCGSDIEGVPKHRRRRVESAVPAPEVPEIPLKELEIPLKELAMKVFPFVSADEGHTSRALARMAGLDSRSEPTVERVKVVMKKLRDVGKVKLEEGKWIRA